MQLSLVAEAASAAEAPRELLLGVLTGPELQQARLSRLARLYIGLQPPSRRAAASGA